MPLHPDAWADYCAELWNPQRRYRTPGELAVVLDPNWRTSPALTLIDEAIRELMDDPDLDALAVFLPPQEGKSQECSRRTPEWLLDWNPALRIGLVSYELDMALRWGRDVKQDVAMTDRARLRIDIRRDSSAAGRWETLAGGGMYCVGIGGPLTGRPIDVLIIDDPVKDRAAAESQRIRDLTWDWWESVALTRLAPGAKVILIQTRWHEDDLAGRILTRPSPLRWRVLSIPALAKAEDDPLGRAVGEELPSVRGRAPGYFRNLQATMSRYVFSGVFQQDPTAPEGNMFRRTAFRYWRPAAPWPDGRERVECEGTPVTLVDCWRFLTVDPAASTKTSADWTVASAWALAPSGDLLLLDRARERVEDHDHFALCLPLVQRWGATQVYVEKSWWARTLVQDAVAAGVPVAPLLADTDKVTRAIPAAGRVHQGKVWFPAEAVWLETWCDELAAFPQGSHDDQVDTLAYAARVITAEYVPPVTPPRGRRDATDVAIAAAAHASTGDGAGDLDIMNIPL